MARVLFQKGHTALITGGASGIGLALTKKCIAHGMHVLIADWDDALLARAPQSVDNATLLSTIKMDVSKPADWALAAEKAKTTFPNGHIHVLALNAGITGPSAWATAPDSFERVLSVNLYGVIHGIATFLDTVKTTAAAGSRAAVIITGSKQGITNPPGNPAYNASKAAVKTLAEQLSFDLRQEKERLSVHLLVPGWTFTGLSGNRPGDNKEKPEGAWWPEQVIEYAQPKIEEGQFWIICPDGQVTEDLVSTLAFLFLLSPQYWPSLCFNVSLVSSYLYTYFRTARECSGERQMSLKAGLLSPGGETSGSKSTRIGLIHKSDPSQQLIKPAE